MPLTYEVQYSIRKPLSATTPAGHEDLKYVPTSHTLIFGEKDALLVDTPLVNSSSIELGNWIASSGKNLRYIYITHPHGDHYFGLPSILARFPEAEAIATKKCVELMIEEVARQKEGKGFFSAFSDDIESQKLVVPTALESDTFELEGEEIRIVPTGHTDTNHTSTLFVPSIGLAVTGDAVYNHVFPFMGESQTPQLRAQWRDALDKIASLKPKYVVGGHKKPGRDDGPKCIAETKNYLEELEVLGEQSLTRAEFYEEVLKRHPGFVNVGSLWGAAGIMTAK